jgi:hypothetical protein
MEDRLRFVFEYERRERSMIELCHGSRSRARPAMSGCGATGTSERPAWAWRKLQSQPAERPPQSVNQRSHARREHSRAAKPRDNQTPEGVEQMVLDLRQAHMRGGPRKLKWVLERYEPVRNSPASGTIGALLKRERRWRRGRARSVCLPRPTANRWRTPIKPTTRGAPISKVGSAPRTASATIR